MSATDDHAAGPRDEEAVHAFIERIAMTLANLGFPRMSGRVLMTLECAEEDGLTARDLAERLDASPAAISGAVRTLTNMGLIFRDPVRGSRRDVYRLPEDPWYEMAMAKGNIYKQFADLTVDGIDAVGGTTTQAGRRVRELHNFFLFIGGEMEDLFMKWSEIKATTRGDA
jgi:hypothetical protein